MGSLDWVTGWLSAALLKKSSSLGRGSSPAQLAPDTRDDVSGVVSQIEGVWADTRKAWFQTPLHLRIVDKRLTEARDRLSAGSAAEIAAFMRDLSGEVLVRTDGEFWSGASRMAEPVMEALLEPLVERRMAGGCVDLEALKHSVVHWVRFGERDAEPADTPACSARQISDLVVSSLGCGRVNPERVRLGLVSPMVPVVETLLIMLRLGLAVAQPQGGGANG